MIEIKNVSKTFKYTDKKVATEGLQDVDKRISNGKFEALRDVSFSCDKGKTVGLIGPNGAGKTTLLKILATILKPTQGQILIEGQDFTKHPTKIRQKIGYLTNSTGLYHRLTVREMIQYIGRLNGLKGEYLENRIDELFERFEINDFANKFNGMLSLGMAQRVSIVRSIIHAPDILVFDEPTTGLDIMMSHVILEYIQEYKEMGNTVLFSTHNMHEVDKLCDDIILINKGVICYEGALINFKNEFDKGDLVRSVADYLGGVR